LPPPEAGHKGLRERAIEALGDALTRTERAASYLRARGVHQLGELGELTVEPTEVLLAAGFSRAEIEKAGVVRDLRFVGRLCCVWRDENGRARSLWGRSLNGEEPKYLVLAGEVPPLFAADTGLLAARRGRRPEGVLVVEGMMDPLSLREAGFEHVVAVGRAGVSPEALERLEAVGGATLCLDADAAGVAGLWRAVDAWARSRSPVKLFVASIEGAKDPDELVRQHGASALQRAIDARVPAASAWVERASAAATTEAELFAVAGRAVSFLADVALCHPLEAAAASELLAKRGINGAMLKLATRSLPREELLRVRESLARRLAEVDALLMEP
jgi:DNA primase